MGEFAIRKLDNQEIKIGTCEAMYYLRFEDRNQVEPIANNIDPDKDINIYFRIPKPEEDGIKPGNYENHICTERLWAKDEKDYCFNFAGDKDTLADPGTMQVSHESGLLLNVACYHGQQLPEATEQIKPFWNGKSWFFELRFIKKTASGLMPVICCRHCNKLWSIDWAELLPYVHGELKQRLIKYSEVKL